MSTKESSNAFWSTLTGKCRVSTLSQPMFAFVNGKSCFILDFSLHFRRHQIVHHKTLTFRVYGFTKCQHNQCELKKINVTLLKKIESKETMGLVKYFKACKTFKKKIKKNGFTDSILFRRIHSHINMYLFLKKYRYMCVVQIPFQIS